MTLKVLHLDDDLIILDRFAEILKKQKTISQKTISVESFHDTSKFFERLKSTTVPDVVLIDVHLEGQKLTGVEIARMVREQLSNVVLLVVSSSRDSKIIRDCLRAGADDFVSKEVEPVELATRIEASLDHKERAKESKARSQKQTTKISSGATMDAIERRVESLIRSAVNCIYIEGESGTGKEVVANLFAAALPANVPFVRVNCGAIAPTLIASELFGHVKGSFTGAQSDKAGLIESADGGWIFLDEVATLPTDAQVSLLRTIDNQSIRRVGSNAERPLQFRVISATNEPLSELVEVGKFRKDLWQRLRETQINLPPLRERKHEIPQLVEFFLASMRGGPYQLAPTVLDTLKSYDWADGNIRELRNVLRAMTEQSVGSLLTPKSIPERIWDALDEASEEKLGKSVSGETGTNTGTHHLTLQWSGARPSIDTLAQLLLVEILKQEHRQHGQLSLRGLGKALGMAKSTLATRLKGLVEDRILSQEDLGSMLKISGNNLKDDQNE